MKNQPKQTWLCKNQWWSELKSGLNEEIERLIGMEKWKWKKIERSEKWYGTSSAETEISLAFSSASWRMNLTICWICWETSVSFILTVASESEKIEEGGREAKLLPRRWYDYEMRARPSSMAVCVDEKYEITGYHLFIMHLPHDSLMNIPSSF